MVLDTDSVGMDSRSDIAVAVHTVAAVVVDIAVVVRTAAVVACHTVVAVGNPADHKEPQVAHDHKVCYLAADHKAWHLAPFAVVAVHKRASLDTADFEHRNSPELRVQLRDASVAVVD